VNCNHVISFVLVGKALCFFAILVASYGPTPMFIPGAPYTKLLPNE